MLVIKEMQLLIAMRELDAVMSSQSANEDLPTTTPGTKVSNETNY